MYYFLLYFFVVFLPLSAVEVGIDLLLEGDYDALLKKKRVGLLINHTAVNSRGQSTFELLKEYSVKNSFQITALFAPEHGIKGDFYASESIEDEQSEGIPIYSLHGKLRRPTKEMLEKIDLLIFDIQDIGSRSYTFISTLFYAMEEAAKHKIEVVVLDRPNPINGLIVDGLMMEEKFRSIVGYINIPYCHGMTVCELAQFFNSEYQIGCKLHIVPMRGWKRDMSFQQTGLAWIPTSPNIPEASTPLFYPATGILGELQIVSIGVGYTLPFKVVGAPWIDAELFASTLNAQNLPGIHFIPFYFKPFYGRFSKQNCQGVLLTIEDIARYRPVQTQYAIIGILKSLYPVAFKKALECSKERREMFAKINGTDEVYRIISEEQYIIWPLKNLQNSSLKDFLKKRQNYLIPSYS